MTVYQRIIKRLDDAQVKYRAVSHQPTKTCADSARIRGTTLDQGAKALVCFADKKPIMIVLPCSHKLDAKLFKATFGVRDLRFASPDEVTQVTGLEVGAISPWGSLFGLTTYVDEVLGETPEIAFNAGDVRRSVLMAFSDYLLLEKPWCGKIS